MNAIYEQMAERIMLKDSKMIPELFRMIADIDEGELLMAMPGTPAELAEKIGKPADTVEKMCLSLYHKGLAFKSFREGGVRYKMCRDIVQFHDATILWPEAPQEYHDLWQRFMEEEWPEFARSVEKLLPRPFSRVVPVQEAVAVEKQQILDSESVDRIVENADTLAVTRCTCRLIAHKCDNPVEVCLQVGNAAKYTIDRGTGREVSKEEALEILRKCEEAGLVHVTINSAHVGHFICNCCSCCCQVLPLIISEGLRLADPSRYRAAIDPEECTACGTCLDRCLFNAIEEREKDGATIMQVIDQKCMGCGLCQPTCPEEAIQLKEVRPADFIPS